MNKLTKTQVSKMTTAELQEQRLDLAASITSKTSERDQNIIKGYISMIEVELHNRDKQIANQPEEDKNIGGNVQMEETKVVFQVPSTLAGAMKSINDILAGADSDNTKLAKIMKVAENNVDYTDAPYELCSDAELLRRLKLVWSKKVAAKKAGKLDVLADLEQQESVIGSYRTAQVNRTGVVSSDNVDHSKLSQLDLQKLIRNYQSKKSNAKKLHEALLVEIAKATDPAEVHELTKQADENKNLMEHWQAKVDDASKYRTSTPAAAKNVELANQIKDMIALLKTLPQSPEVEAQIAKLEASIK